MISLFLLMFICFGCFGGYVHNDNIIDEHINQQQVKNVAFDVPGPTADDKRIIMNMYELAHVDTMFGLIEYITALQPSFNKYGDSVNLHVATPITLFGGFTTFVNNNFFINTPTSSLIGLGNQINDVNILTGSEGSSGSYISRYVKLDIYTALTASNIPTFSYKYSYDTDGYSIHSPLITYTSNFNNDRNMYLITFYTNDEDKYSNFLVAWADRGHTSNYNNGFEIGVSQGKAIGEQIGFEKGIEYAEDINSTALTIFEGIIQVGLLPVNVFLQIFNFELFGINISGIISALLSVSIAIIIIRFLLGGRNNDK